MICRRYEENDFPQVREWGNQWGANYQEHQFPQTGFIVDGVAAYFLYSTDSEVCWLENLICRKDVDSMTKSRALHLLTTACLKEAKEQGFKVAYATTDNVKVAQRAREMGATVSGNQFLITKDLTQPAHLM